MAANRVTVTKDENKESQPFSILDLPPELICYIVKYIKEEDIIWLARTCNYLYNIVKSCFPKIYVGPHAFAVPIGRLDYFQQSKFNESYGVYYAGKMLSYALKQQDFICSEKILSSYELYIHKQREEFIKNAAYDGNLPAIIWLHERNFEWGMNAYKIAAKGGHMEILQYFMEHGCSFDRTVCLYASLVEHF